MLKLGIRRWQFTLLKSTRSAASCAQAHRDQVFSAHAADHATFKLASRILQVAHEINLDAEALRAYLQALKDSFATASHQDKGRHEVEGEAGQERQGSEVQGQGSEVQGQERG